MKQKSNEKNESGKNESKNIEEICQKMPAFLKQPMKKYFLL